jgi:hypothetical protein
VVQSEHANDQFGTAVVIEGDRMVVGAPGANDGAFDAGAVHVFGRDGGEWRREAVLTADEPVPHGAFGGFLALRGDVLAIGAPMQSGHEMKERHGTSYIFERVEGAWEQRLALRLEDVDADTFGVGVAIGVERAAFSAVSRRRDETRLSGVVVVVVRDGDGWREEARLEDGAYPAFGLTLAMDDEHLIVSDGTGAALAYRREGAQWVGGEALALPADAKLGLPTVRLSGAWLVLGAGYASPLYFFRRTGTTWEPTQVLDLGVPRLFAALALDGGRAAAGVDAGDMDMPYRHEVVVLERAGDRWEVSARVSGSNEPGTAFGEALSLSAGRLAVADPDAGAFAGQRVGEVRIYAGPTWSEDAVVSPDSIDDAGCGCRSREGSLAGLGWLVLLGWRRRRCAE